MTPQPRLRQQAVTLWLDPQATLLRGETQLELHTSTPLDTLTLTARALRLTHAEMYVDGTPTALRIHVDGPTVRLVAPNTLPAGHMRLGLRWTGTVQRAGPGLCRFDVAGQAYASSRMAAGMAGAAGVFPALAQPALRTSILLTVYAPVGVSVAASARVLERRGVGSGACWRFAATPPIPIGAMAVAIGPFTVTEPAVTDATGRGPHIRILSPGGAPVAPGLQSTARALVEALEVWTGCRYPYDTLTLVGVNHPIEAQQSAGLVPIAITRLVTGGPALEGVLARALARVWIGGLVSLPDAPLFEAGLALWLAHRVVSPDRLAVERPLDALDEADDQGQTALFALSLALFDAHAPRALADGLPRFLRRHGHQSAGIEDLRACLDPAVAALLPTALPTDRVHVEWADSTRVRLLRSAQSPAPALMRLRIGQGARVQTVAAVLDAGVIEIELPWAPSWIQPDADANAPMRWRLSTPALHALLTHDDRLTIPERAALPGHIWDHFVADRLPADETLDALLRLARGPDLGAVLTAMFRLRVLARRLVPDSHRAALADLVATAVTPAWARIGLWPRADDTQVATQLRPWLVEAMLDMRAEGVAGSIVAQADLIVGGHDPERAEIALPWAARVAGGAGYFDALEAALTGASPRLRPALIAALGNFVDPTLIARGLNLALGGGIHRLEWLTLMRPIAQRREGRDQLRALIERRFDPLVSHLSPTLLARLPELAHDARTASERSAWATTFAAPRLRLHGIPAAVDRMLQTIDANIRLAAHASSSLRARLARRGTGSR